MTVTEEIRDIFSILHDGTISAWTGDKYLLTLTVECEYLAERINKSFDKFYLEIFNVHKIEFVPWMDPIELPTIVKTEYAAIFKAELDILTAKIREDVVEILCNQGDKSFNYCGGSLILGCKTIKVYDQHRNELTIEQFKKIGTEYWSKFHKK